MRSGSPLTSRTSRNYAAYVRRHRVLLLTFALLGVAVAAVSLVREPPSYVASTRVALNAYEVAPSIVDDRPRLISPDSDAQVLSSIPVLARAAARTGYPGGADALAQRLAVSAVPNSRILVVRVPDLDADRAVATATAIVEEFLVQRAGGAQIRADDARATLDRMIATVSERLTGVRREAGGSVLSSAQQAEETRLTDELRELQRAVARSATAPQDPGFVVAEAALVDAAGPPPGLAVLVSGGLIGIVAGFGTSRLLDLRRAPWRRVGARRSSSWTV